MIDNNSIKSISILGSTGSIGTQTLDVIKKKPENYKINWLTTNSNIDLLKEQIKQFSPFGVVIANEEKYTEFKNKANFSGEILCGKDGLIQVGKDDSDLLVSSLVGFAGVRPTLEAIKLGRSVALANKETLVSAGGLITSEAKKSGSKIIAIDSEHNAILQCLVGEDFDSIEKLILTASGGPFRNTPTRDFKDITPEKALKHPNWEMGQKITIDSASMMNKGLELIEAFWLFGVDAKKLDVLVHPESIIHSMVEFTDGSTKAQMGLPDMRVPISYALSYPERLSFDFPRMNLAEIGKLTFEEPDYEKFRCLTLAFDVLKNNPDYGVVLNAANEIAVDAFLNKKIRFDQIADLIEMTLGKIEIKNAIEIDEIIEIDARSRVYSQEMIGKL
jgi:1-deoxy-D-xylulose-5-phosphate reductoisomerase